MTVKVKNIIPAVTTGTAATTRYTCEVLNTIIDKMSLTNNSSVNAIISVYIVASGDSADDSNKIINNVIILSGDTFTALEVMGHYMAAGDEIIVQSSVGTVALMASGREVS